MSFAIVGAGRSEPEFCCFLTPPEAAIAATGSHRCYTTMERKGRAPPPHRRGTMHGNEHRQQPPRRPRTGRSQRDQGSPPGYFSAELVLVFLFVAASLAFLPLVLPPLAPPPILLLLVPVGLLAVLVALAFVPLDAQSHLVVASRM